MPQTTAKQTFWRGARDGLPFVLVVMPFALLFGVVATEAGLNLTQAMGLSVLVIAGAAQFTAVQLLVDNAPVWVVLAASLGVNLRMAMYSASLVPHLGAAPLWQRALAGYFLVDQNYAAGMVEYEKHPDMTLAQKTAFFFGVMLPIAPLWYLGTFIGAVAGTAIPPEYALDFALPLMFLALVVPALRALPHFVAAGVAIVVALAAASLPSGFGVLLAGILGMIAGAETERRMGPST